jgi:hypothetical protein
MIKSGSQHNALKMCFVKIKLQRIIFNVFVEIRVLRLFFIHDNRKTG